MGIHSRLNTWLEMATKEHHQLYVRRIYLTHLTGVRAKYSVVFLDSVSRKIHQRNWIDQDLFGQVNLSKSERESEIYSGLDSSVNLGPPVNYLVYNSFRSIKLRFEIISFVLWVVWYVYFLYSTCVTLIFIQKIPFWKCNILAQILMSIQH